MHKKISIGFSVEGRELICTHFPATVKSSEKKSLLFLGGVHGNEVEGVWLLEHALQLWQKEAPKTALDLYVWPQVNPDGVAKLQRTNANGVDLNRNLPTKDWTSEILNPRYPPGPAACSEPENKALVEWINKTKPSGILTVHSFEKPQVNSNGPSEKWAEALGQICGYAVTRDIGYPTPGSFGTYAGKERGMPVITLEILRGLEKEKVIEKFIPLLTRSILFWENEAH